MARLRAGLPQSTAPSTLATAVAQAVLNNMFDAIKACTIPLGDMDLGSDSTTLPRVAQYVNAPLNDRPTALPYYV